MDHRVTHIIEQMRARLHADLNIDALAAEVGLSASRLGFLFRHETGRSPGAFLHTLRMERARLLLESTDLTVGDVMRQVGLSDPSHFSRDFRNAHGFSPRAFRIQLRLAGPPLRYIRGDRVVAHAHDLRMNRPTGPHTALPRPGNNETDHHNNDTNHQESADEHHEAVDGNGGAGMRDDDRGGGARRRAGKWRR